MSIIRTATAVLQVLLLPHGVIIAENLALQHQPGILQQSATTESAHVSADREDNILAISDPFHHQKGLSTPYYFARIQRPISPPNSC